MKAQNQLIEEAQAAGIAYSPAFDPGKQEELMNAHRALRDFADSFEHKNP